MQGRDQLDNLVALKEFKQAMSEAENELISFNDPSDTSIRIQFIQIKVIQKRFTH